MAFEATKREWGELYAFFRLLADGYVYAGTPEVKKNEAQRLPVAMIQREEHDGGLFCCGGTDFIGCESES